MTLDEYEALRAGAKMLECDAYGDKVLRLANGNILKLFRRKRLLSSSAWKPYAQRFADNCEALKRLGIPVPEVISVRRVPAISRDIVLYAPLPGNTLRELRRSCLPPGEENKLKQQFIQFVSRLHDKGIYFRSLHLGNVVLTPDGTLGLIDVADLKIYRRPLNDWLRGRNTRRIKTIQEDMDFLVQD